ncbi:MAG: S1C family serine protease [Anaerolineae bacterium]
MRSMRRGTSLVSMVLLLALLVGCAAQTASNGAGQLVEEAQPATQADVQLVQYAAAPAIDASVLTTVQATFEQIYTNVNPSVVNIQVSGAMDQTQVNGEGSGFVWDGEGHIVTNNHVVADAARIDVIFADGATAQAELVGADPESDLAVIKVDPSAVELQPVTLADPQAVQVGDLVIAIGNPYGLAGTMTQGIVSALARSLSVSGPHDVSTGTYAIPDIIQTDAAINPGNSGGVLVDIAGHVVGVTSAIQSSTNANSGIGFVIPSHIVKRVAPVLIADGAYEHPRIGISGTSLTASLAEEIGLESSQQGVLVITVTANGPADEAGLVGAGQQQEPGQVSITGGDVIVAVDGQAVTTFEDLISYIFNETEVGQTIDVTILRGGKEQTVELTLSVVS